MAQWFSLPESSESLAFTTRSICRSCPRGAEQFSSRAEWSRESAAGKVQRTAPGSRGRKWPGPLEVIRALTWYQRDRQTDGRTDRLTSVVGASQCLGHSPPPLPSHIFTVNYCNNKKNIKNNHGKLFTALQIVASRMNEFVEFVCVCWRVFAYKNTSTARIGTGGTAKRNSAVHTPGQRGCV